MASVSNLEVVNMTKKVYGDLTNLLPQDQHLEKDIPFTEKQKVGESYNEAVVLTAETGITFGGSGSDAFELNPAIAGAVKQATVTPYVSVLGSIVPWGLISRTAGGGEKAFYDGTKHIFRNNLKSHGKFLEIMRLYGQATALLGYVSYSSATYRGVSLTAGAGTINNIVFATGGVNTTSKHILLAPGQFAAGIWVGMEGVKVQQVNSSGVVVAEGKLVAVESEYGYIEVDFTPVAASSATSHRLCFEGMGDAKEMVGISKILSTNGTLFGINNAQYRLYRGNTATVSGKLLFTGATGLNAYVANMVNAGGLEGDLDFYINPRSWATLNNTESGNRDYDSSYKSNEASNGFEDIVYHTQTGRMTFKAHRMVKEGDAFGLHLPSWSRSGSAEISFKVPGIDKEIIFPLENQAAWAFRSYADQYVFCHEPCKNLYLTGINDEAA